MTSRALISKFTVRFRTIRKELDSSMYNNIKCWTSPGLKYIRWPGLFTTRAFIKDRTDFIIYIVSFAISIRISSAFFHPHFIILHFYHPYFFICILSYVLIFSHFIIRILSSSCYLPHFIIPNQSEAEAFVGYSNVLQFFVFFKKITRAYLFQITLEII